MKYVKSYDSVNFAEAVLSHSAIVLTELVLFFGVVIIFALHPNSCAVYCACHFYYTRDHICTVETEIGSLGRDIAGQRSKYYQNYTRRIGGFKDAHILGVRGVFPKRFQSICI